MDVAMQGGAEPWELKGRRKKKKKKSDEEEGEECLEYIGGDFY